MVAITVEEVSKAFGSVQALDLVSLRVEPGEIFFLLGPSGCGKTTLLRSLAGFNKLDSGRIYFDEEDVTAMPPHRRQTAMMFQSYALWPHLSVSKNIAFGLEQMKLPKHEVAQRVEEALSMVQLDGLGERSIHALSGGQQQRVALARALVVRPKCLFLDEPLSNLDAKLRLEMRLEIRRLCKDYGVTAVYVTHDQKEALSVADRMAILEDGRVAQIGTPQEVYRSPHNCRVASFIGETNFIGALVSSIHGQCLHVETDVGPFEGRVGDPSWMPDKGDSVVLAIRPETLTLRETPSVDGNAIDGYVVDGVYLGETAQYRLKASDGTEIQVSELNPSAMRESSRACLHAYVSPQNARTHLAPKLAVNRLWVIVLALVAVLSLPFLMRPQYDHDPRLAKSPNQILSIITPHSESIRQEFTTAFRRFMRETEGREVFIEWRVPGGTSEIEKVLDTEFTFAFQNYWTDTLNQSWSSSIATAFNDRKRQLPDSREEDTLEDRARREFLDSNVGAKFDLFFGGGAYPFVVNAAKGYLIDSGVLDRHPEWFAPDIIPAEVGGEPFYDAAGRWMGCCLSTFGVCYNTDSFKRLGIPEVGVDWSTLARPDLFKEVALADPTMSGTVTKAFEMILQQAMRRHVEERGSGPEVLADGWREGLNLIRRIGANARYFANFSAKIPADVAAGNAAAGMSIDYYGRTYSELLQDEKSNSRLAFIMPLGGSSTSVDPIGVLRGGPNRELTDKFIDFVFSKRGQQLWNNRAGTDDGPERQSLRRLPVRRDLYTTEELVDFADPDVMPFERSSLFYYESDWTGPAFGAIRFIMKAMCLDPHEELQTAWQALIENDFPEQALQAFNDITPVTYALALGEISTVLKQGKREQNTHALHLSRFFRERYQQATALARPGPD